MVTKLCVVLDPRAKMILEEYISELRKKGFNVTKSTLVSKIVTEYVTTQMKRELCEQRKREKRKADMTMRYIMYIDPWMPKEFEKTLEEEEDEICS